MEQNLRVGEGYAPARSNLKKRNIRYISLLAVLTSMCLYARAQRPRFSGPVPPGMIVLFLLMAMSLSGSAQFYKPSNKTVRMGELLPDSFYSITHQAVNAETGQQTTMKFADYKDRLIILDFWASWCKPCIGSLNKQDSIIAKLAPESAVVVPVTYQTAAKVLPTLKKYQWKMTSIVGDTTLSQIFPYRSLPHMVWIKDGEVIAFPVWHHATFDNIQRVLRGEQLQIPMRIQDTRFNPKEKLFVADNGDTKILYRGKQGTIAGFVPGYMPERLQLITTADSTILYCANQKLLTMLYDAFEDDVFPHLKPKANSGIYWDCSEDVRKAIQAEGKGDGAALFGYELRRAGKLTKREMLAQMQHDLNAYFGELYNMEAKVEKRAIEKYGVLRLLGKRNDTKHLLQNERDSKTVTTGPVKRYAGFPFGQQFYYLMVDGPLRRSTVKGLTMMVVDSTGIDPDLSVSFHFSEKIEKGSTLAQINGQLKRYGLRLTVEEQAVPALVIKEKYQ